MNDNMHKINWDRYPNFKKEEFDCSETGENNMVPGFLEVLQQIRTTYARPMIITSGFRSHDHSIERKKNHPGEHTYGLAADVRAAGIDAMDLIMIAMAYGVRRIGVKQHGAFYGRFIHLGWGDKIGTFPEAIWTYG